MLIFHIWEYIEGLAMTLLTPKIFRNQPLNLLPFLLSQADSSSEEPTHPPGHEGKRFFSAYLPFVFTF
jgi:hypothetical protein